jgi:putative transposase
MRRSFAGSRRAKSRDIRGSKSRAGTTRWSFPPTGMASALQEKLRIQHVGQVKVKQHRGMEGAIKTVTLKREADKWYAIFSCDLGEVSMASSANPPVGIDVGIESFFTTSEGEHEPNPAYLKAQLPALRRAGRAVSRRTKCGC